ncbi:NACHT domain-containing protein [Streptomyces sp. LX-29]|uniref:NACHT domain-containing protein n=1 Tax=Streptomyces sp. LX-29 TaxID=2900152 RepID=UPI00240E4654|nr:NACHT domain-containing protein [Streptomyces sp. LX-29]WFB10209.1 NACHT domain-containing protein [Streptomyces sp. LX-29]
MQGVESVVLKLAGTVVTTVAKSLWEKRRRELTAKETSRLVDKLAGRVREACGTAAPEHERIAALATVSDCFTAAGAPDLKLLLSLDLEPEALRRHVLEEARGVRRRAALDEAAAALFDRVLDVCCAHIIEYVTTLPEFAARSQAELIRRAGRTEAALEDVRRRLGPGPERTAAEFETRYADYVATTHSRLQLFGVTLSAAGQEWALDTAYISLSVSGEPPDAHADLHDLAPTTLRIEHALADRSRLLLRGPAGSGKSTLVQWLATNAARRSFGPELATWNTCVPFVLRLRALTEQDSPPLPRDFLSSMGNPLAGAAPQGWVEGLLASGRALVLVDGVDEVPQRLRKRTEEWLRSLVAAFPDARYVVTTRPSAVPDYWLAGNSFRAHSLLPMSREDVRSFITHWHDAARREPSAPADLDAYEESLLQAVASRRELAHLSTNPLMCALLCALNRDRRTHLPRARKELYDAALEMLLVRRDTERDICAVEGVELTRDEQTLLLQELAYWLIRNGQVEAARDEAVDMIDTALAAMPQVRAQGDAQQVFRHLLIRSGLLREPAPGAVNFVHRTFQDYLAAKAAVEARDFGLLVSKAHDDRWDDVVRMAVGHARPEERARLLRGLLRRADKVKRHRQRLNLLAAACLEQAPQLDPAVRGEVEGRVRELIPPKDFWEAQELAMTGELVLDLLPGPHEIEDDWGAAFVTSTLRLVGGPTAMSLLARFRHHGASQVQVQVAMAWDRYDAAEYVDAVLKDAGAGVYLTVNNLEQLRLLPRLSQYTWVSVSGELPLFDYLGPQVESLQIRANPELDSLAPLAQLPALRTLNLSAGLKPTLDMGPLRELSLTSFALGFDLATASLESLPLGPELSHLSLASSAETIGLDGIGRWPHLAALDLMASQHGGQLHLLGDLPRLQRLHLAQQADLHTEALLPNRRLERLALFECELPHGLAPLTDLPLLRGLDLSRCTQNDDPVDLAPLLDLPDVVITINDGQVRNEHLFPPDRIARPRRMGVMG